MEKEQIINFKEYGYKSNPNEIIKELQEIGADIKNINIGIIKDDYNNLIFDYTIKFIHMKKVERLFNKYYPVHFTLILED